LDKFFGLLFFMWSQMIFRLYFFRFFTPFSCISSWMNLDDLFIKIRLWTLILEHFCFCWYFFGLLFIGMVHSWRLKLRFEKCRCLFDSFLKLLWFFLFTEADSKFTLVSFVNTFKLNDHIFRKSCQHNIFLQWCFWLEFVQTKELKFNFSWEICFRIWGQNLDNFDRPKCAFFRKINHEHLSFRHLRPVHLVF